MPFLMVGATPKNSKLITSHQHTFYEITLCTEGCGIALIGDTEYPFQAGSILIIPPNVPHTSRSENGYTEIYIQTESKPLHNEVYLEDDGEKAVTALMQMMLHRYIRGEKNDLTLSLMYDLLMQLLAEKCTDPQNDPIVEDVRRLLALHYNDPQISLSKLLESTGYHIDYIRRRFVAACGMKPSEYLTSLRIENAKKLLQQKNTTRFSIADIGMMCGYYDPNYFSRVFKKHVGITPEQFVISLTGAIHHEKI